MGADIMEFAKEMGIEVATEGPLKMLLRGACRYANRNNDALREAWELEARDRQVRVLNGQAQKLADLQDKTNDQGALLSKLEAMVNSHEYWRLQGNLGYEAMRSTLDSRKEMIEAAQIGLVDPNMSIEAKARVERTLRNLDPDDVKILDQLRRFHQHAPKTEPRTQIPIPPGKYAEGSRNVLSAAPMSRSVLITTGCTDTEATGGGPMYVVSQLGELVLRALSTYAPVGWGRSDE